MISLQTAMDAPTVSSADDKRFSVYRKRQMEFSLLRAKVNAANPRPMQDTQSILTRSIVLGIPAGILSAWINRTDFARNISRKAIDFCEDQASRHEFTLPEAWHVCKTWMSAGSQHYRQLDDATILSELPKKRNLLSHTLSTIASHVGMGVLGGTLIGFITNSRRQNQADIEEHLPMVDNPKDRKELIKDLKRTKRSPFWNAGLAQVGSLLMLPVNPVGAAVNVVTTAAMYHGVFQNDVKRNRRIDNTIKSVQEYGEQQELVEPTLPSSK
jgi:hypothetical protein